MEENFNTPLGESPVVERGSEEQGKIYKFPGKTRDFLSGLFFGLAGSIILTLVDLLLIAAINPGSILYDKIINLLVTLGPLLLLGLFAFFIAYFFKRRRYLSYGLMFSFFLFLCLFMIMIKIVL